MSATPAARLSPKPFRPLARRLALALALLAVFTAALTGYFLYQDGRQALIATAEYQLSTATRLLGSRLATALDDVRRDIQLLAGHPDSARALQGDRESRHRTEALFARFIENRRGYLQIRLISAAEGLEVVRVDRSRGQPVIVDGDDRQEKGHYPYVFETLSLPAGGLYLSPAVINHERGAHDAEEQPSGQLAIQINRADGLALGVLVINLDLRGILDLLVSDLPPDTDVYLTNATGDFLIHPDAEQAFAFDRGRRVQMQTSFPETLRLLDETFVGSLVFQIGPARKAHEEGAGDHLASFARIDTAPEIWQGAGQHFGIRFFIGLAQAMTGIEEQSRNMAENVAIKSLISGVVAVLLAVLFSRAITAPLQRITAAMSHIGKPDAALLPTDRNDEIGMLARRFSAMQQQIGEQLETLETQRQALDHEAQHDWLTGIANRRNFISFLPQALARAGRRQSGLALFFIDLDGFKEINDLHGHATGDAVLVEVARRLLSSVRTGDFVARPGGDEFVIVCEDLRTPAEAVHVAEKILQKVAEPQVVGDARLTVGASIGIARFPEDGHDADMLTIAADRAMYAAKAQGRGNFFMATDLVVDAPPPVQTGSNGVKGGTT